MLATGIHYRMPVVIPPEAFERWLDCRTREPREVAELMQPADDGLFEAIPVSDLVNKVSNMGPDVQKPVPLAEPAHVAPGATKDDGTQIGDPDHRGQ